MDSFPNQWIKHNTFSRDTIIIACNILSGIGHSSFDNLMLKFGLESKIPQGSGTNLQNKATALARFSLDNPSHNLSTIQGTQKIDVAIIHHVISETPHKAKENQEFRSWLAHDGFSIFEEKEESYPWREKLVLHRMHPDIADIPTADDEVHSLLKKHKFDTPLGHLKQAINAHTRGEWASSNSQIRSFFEGLFDEIARRLAPEKTELCIDAKARRSLLANLPTPFLSKNLNEWDDGQKQAFIPALFNRLHPEGSHPGLSDEEDSTFRLHIILITSRLILKRYSALSTVL